VTRINHSTPLEKQLKLIENAKITEENFHDPRASQDSSDMKDVLA
jgi:hypothetical protein